MCCALHAGMGMGDMDGVMEEEQEEDDDQGADLLRQGRLELSQAGPGPADRAKGTAAHREAMMEGTSAGARVALRIIEDLQARDGRCIAYVLLINHRKGTFWLCTAPCTAPRTALAHLSCHASPCSHLLCSTWTTTLLWATSAPSWWRLTTSSCPPCWPPSSAPC